MLVLVLLWSLDAWNLVFQLPNRSTQNSEEPVLPDAFRKTRSIRFSFSPLIVCAKIAPIPKQRSSCTNVLHSERDHL
jgi:hypothetical protein